MIKDFLQKTTAVILISLLTLSGCMLPQEEALLPPVLLQPAEINFITMEVGRGDIIDIIEDRALVVPSVHYQLTFPHRSGYLEAIEVIRGSEVKEGDVLARIETGSLEMEIIRQKIIIEKQQLSIEEIRVLGGNRFTRRQAELTLELEEIRLQQLEHELEQAVITAPMDGVIIWMTDAAIGDFINARVPVLTIADPKHVHFEYTGLLMPQMHFGMEVEIQIGENLIPAKIALNPADTPEEYVRERRERVFIIPNDPDDLPDEVVPGMRYGFRILLEEKHDVIIVPVSAVSTFSRQSFVQVLIDGLRTERDISIGIADGTNVEVLSGLYEGELLIIGIER